MKTLVHLFPLAVTGWDDGELAGSHVIQEFGHLFDREGLEVPVRGRGRNGHGFSLWQQRPQEPEKCEVVGAIRGQPRGDARDVGGLIIVRRGRDISPRTLPPLSGPGLGMGTWHRTYTRILPVEIDAIQVMFCRMINNSRPLVHGKASSGPSEAGMTTGREYEP